MSFHLAVVTGASSGIGKALSKRLDEKGIPQIIVGRTTAALEELAAECRNPVEVVSADLSTSTGIAKVATIIRERAPDLVINNAGIGLYGAATDLSSEQQQALVRLNSEAVVVLTVEAAKALQREKKKGCILNVSSVAGYLTFPCLAAYAASKAFVNHFTESMAMELEGSGIDLLLACPGQVDTAFRERAAQGVNTGSVNGQSMTVDFAVEQLWSQITARKPISIFNRRYRLATWIGKNILPKKMLGRFLEKNIREQIE